MRAWLETGRVSALLLSDARMADTVFTRRGILSSFGDGMRKKCPPPPPLYK